MVDKKLELKFIGDYTPKYATKGSAGFDLICPVKTRVFPGELVKIDMRLKFEIPKGYYLEIVPRSSLAKTGLVLANSVGIIDSDYRQSLFAVLRNLSKTKVIIKGGDRILQAILKPVEQVTLKKVNEIEDTTRGGYGSTGR